MYERVNRSSFAQSMRTRVRMRHVSKEILVGMRPDGTPVTMLGEGKTWRAPTRKKRHGQGKVRRENLQRLRKLREGGGKVFPVASLTRAIGNLLRP